MGLDVVDIAFGYNVVMEMKSILLLIVVSLCTWGIALFCIGNHLSLKEAANTPETLTISHTMYIQCPIFFGIG